MRLVKMQSRREPHAPISYVAIVLVSYALAITCAFGEDVREVHPEHRSPRKVHSDYRSPQEGTLEHSLSICNAYASEKPLTVVHFRRVSHGDRKTKGSGRILDGNHTKASIGSSELPYKDCITIQTPLQRSDVFTFETGPIQVGKFDVTSLPKKPGSLLLVLHRDTSTAAAASLPPLAATVSPAVTHTGPDHAEASPQASFISRVLLDMPNPLTPHVAVIDAYSGPKPGTLTIAEREDSQRVLKFDSQLALKPSRYELTLFKQGNVTRQTSLPLDLTTTNSTQDRVLVMRVGHDSQGSKRGDVSFPEELVAISLLSKRKMTPGAASPIETAFNVASTVAEKLSNGLSSLVSLATASAANMQPM